MRVNTMQHPDQGKLYPGIPNAPAPSHLRSRLSNAANRLSITVEQAERLHARVIGPTPNESGGGAPLTPDASLDSITSDIHRQVDRLMHLLDSIEETV